MAIHTHFEFSFREDRKTRVLVSVAAGALLCCVFTEALAQQFRSGPPTAEDMELMMQHEQFQQEYERQKLECAKTGNVALVTPTASDGNHASFRCVSPTDPLYRAQHVMEPDATPTELGPVLQALVGQNVAVAVNRFGGPQGEPIIDGDVAYTWGRSTRYTVPHTTLFDENRTSACSIQLFTDRATRIIKRFAWKEERDGCLVYREKLDAPLPPIAQSAPPDADPEVLTVLISEDGVCNVLDASTPCDQLGPYLLAKHLAQNGRISIAVDRSSKYELVAATLESLRGTGFKVGFVNYDASSSQ
jgi:biopolymer transport protein ExbD